MIVFEPGEWKTCDGTRAFVSGKLPPGFGPADRPVAGFVRIDGIVKGCLWDVAGKNKIQGLDLFEFCGEVKNPSAVDHPPHYNSHESGVECIGVAQHENFNIGSVLKYIWRHRFNGKPIQDLEKARKYLGFEIERQRLLENKS